MSQETAAARARIDQFQAHYQCLKAEVGKEIVGYGDVIEKVLISLFAGGHVLLEGVPGLGKTTLVRSLSKAVSVPFSRIQFSPDLMPADILGTNILVLGDDGSRQFRFQKGPIFAGVILADEINRATPKTQSALLEAMQEHRVTVGGTTYTLDEPFFVLGTQNPIEMEGTYPLPEAQVDRFMFKLNVGYLSEDELMQVVDRTTATMTPKVDPVLGPKEILAMRELVREVEVTDHVKRHAVTLARATQPDCDIAPAMVKRFVKFGSSPRGIQTLILGGKVRALIGGRGHLSTGDIDDIALPALRHRILLNFEGEAENVSTDSIVRECIEIAKSRARAAVGA